MYAHSQMAAPVFPGGVQVMIFGPGMRGDDQAGNVAVAANGGHGDGPVMPREGIRYFAHGQMTQGVGQAMDGTGPVMNGGGVPMAIQEESQIDGGNWAVLGAPQAPPDIASHNVWAAYCVEWYRQFPHPNMSIWSHQDWLDHFAAAEQSNTDNDDVVMGAEDLI